MKNYSLLLLFLFFYFAAASQSLPEKSIPNTYQDSTEFAKKLINLAIENNSKIDISNKEIRMKKINMTQARLSWMDNLYASGNLNEFTIEGNHDRAVFYPRYNVGISIPLSIFTKVPMETSKANLEYEIAMEQKNLTERTIKAEVLRRYQTYLTTFEVAKIQDQVLDDMMLDYQLVEKGYKAGKITIEEYNDSLEKLNQQKVQKVMAENQFFIAKINLEEAIGIPLEEVR